MTKREYFYLHVYARGVDKRSIFLDDTDKVRFFLALSLSIRPNAPSMSYVLSQIESGLLTPKNITPQSFDRRYGHPTMDILSAVLMPNHFHLHVRYYSRPAYTLAIKRLLDSYTKYFNKRYGREGRLFSSTAKTVSIASDEQNLYLTSYLHRNPINNTHLKNAAEELEYYPWSTYPQYRGKAPQLIIKGKCTLSTRFFCTPSPILAQFKNREAYHNFVLETDDFEGLLNKKELIDKS